MRTSTWPRPGWPGDISSLVCLLAGGLSNKESATEMGIAEGTVKTYLHIIFRAIGLSTRLEVALWGLSHKEVLKAL